VTTAPAVAGPPATRVEPAPPAPETAPPRKPTVPLVVSPSVPAPGADAPVAPDAPIVVDVEGDADRMVEVPVARVGTPAWNVEPVRPRRRRMRALIAIAGFAMLAFLTGLILFNNLVMPRLIHGIGQVTVPDLTNLTVEQAEQALRPLGLRVTRSGERFDAFVPRGFVLAQDPAAGMSVRGRKHVAIVVSLGEEFSSVPELSGESVRTARMLIDRAGLRAGAIVQAPSEDAGAGLVAGSDPAAEAVLQRSSPVHLLVSTGTVTESFVMPDLLGREITGVRRQLEAFGFRIERTRGAASVGTIVAQDPPPGARITRADVIKLSTSGRVIR
jgi:serine/threonine-protein kinase